MPSAPISASPSTAMRFAAFRGFRRTPRCDPLLVEADQPAAGVDAVGPQPVEHRAMEHALQLAAVDADLRHVVAGVECRAVPATPSGRSDCSRSARGCGCRPGQCRQQAERRQLLDGVRQHVDADAELAHLGGLLEYLGLDAALDASRGRWRGRRYRRQQSGFSCSQDYPSNQLRTDCSGGQRVLKVRTVEVRRSGRGVRTGQAA